jgi:uncharacterized protein (DUF983 family)
MMAEKTNLPDLRNIELGFDSNAVSIEPLRPGSPCPNCAQGKLDYNGLLEFECPVCGYRNADGASYT